MTRKRNEKARMDTANADLSILQIPDIAAPSDTAGTGTVSDATLTLGYEMLVSDPALMATIERTIEMKMSGRGNVDNGDILADAMERIATMLGNGESVTAGTAGLVVKRCVAKASMARSRMVPIATGEVRQDGAMETAETVDIGSVSDRDIYGSDHGPIGTDEKGEMKMGDRSIVIGRHPAMAMLSEPPTYEGKTIAPNAYGRRYLIGPWVAMNPDQWSTADEAIRKGMESVTAIPNDRSIACGPRRKVGEDESGNEILRSLYSPAATLGTLMKRAHRYCSAESLTHEQAFAVEMARCAGGADPRVTYIASKGDPTYSLAKSEPSAESAYFALVDRIAADALASETLYAPDSLMVDTFYVPVTRYRRKAKSESTGAIHQRGTVKRHRHIRWADMVRETGVKRSTLIDRIRKGMGGSVGRWMSDKAAMAVRLLSHGTVPEPFPMGSSWMVHLARLGIISHGGRILWSPRRNAPTILEHGPDIAYHDPHGCSYEQEHAPMESLKREREQREMDIAIGWALACSVDPDAYFLERAYRLSLVKCEWRSFYLTIPAIDWS